jgi:hypothetical protein
MYGRKDCAEQYIRAWLPSGIYPEEEGGTVRIVRTIPNSTFITIQCTIQSFLYSVLTSKWTVPKVRYLGTIHAVWCCAAAALPRNLDNKNVPLGHGVMEWKGSFATVTNVRVRVSRGPLRSHSGYDLPIGSYYQLPPVTT